MPSGQTREPWAMVMTARKAIISFIMMTAKKEGARDDEKCKKMCIVLTSGLFQSTV